MDIVITWVNSNDKNWKEKIQKYKTYNLNNQLGGEVKERYRDYGTLKFLFRSIEKYAPWVRKIFLITDNQVPSWMDTNNKKVKIIDHKDIINSKYLPVFNSNVIEWNMYKIPNLSQNFVYFNDDMLLNKPVTENDFFKNGKPCDCRVYTSMVPVNNFFHVLVNNDILINNYVKNKSKNWPMSGYGIFSLKYKTKLLRNLVLYMELKKSGIPAYFDPHGPISFKKDSFKLADKIWHSEIEINNTHKFREFSDISIWLVRYLQLELGDFSIRRSDFNGWYTINDVKSVIEDLAKSNSYTLCINDTASENYDNNTSKISKALEKKFSKKSKFEK